MSDINTQETVVVGSTALLDLCAFLARYQHDLNELRNELISMTPEAAHEALIMRWPMIQGTQNQMNLTAIGKRPYDLKAVASAVDSILSNGKVCDAGGQS